MTHFSASQLAQLKKLCRIACCPKEDEELKAHLARILEYVSQLEELDTENVAPCRFVLQAGMKQQLREDVVEETLPRDLFLSNAPDQVGGMIRTPPIL